MPDNIKTESQIMMDRNKDLVREIEGFIDSFGDTRENFLHGNCFWFASILYHRFNPIYHCHIMYNQVENHFAILTRCFLFDAGGLRPEGYPYNGWCRWQDFVEDEPLGAERVIRDCICHIEPEEWENLSEKTRHNLKCIYLDFLI